jgi:hypothetical protein
MNIGTVEAAAVAAWWRRHAWKIRSALSAVGPAFEEPDLGHFGLGDAVFLSPILEGGGERDARGPESHPQ